MGAVQVHDRPGARTGVVERRVERHLLGRGVSLQQAPAGIQSCEA